MQISKPKTLNLSPERNLHPVRYNDTIRVFKALEEVNGGFYKGSQARQQQHTSFGEASEQFEL